MIKKILFICFALCIVSCGPSMKAERMTTAAGDEKALNITDEWVATDTNMAVKVIIEKLLNHARYNRYLASRKSNKTPKLIIGEVENQTSEDNFPINALNNKILDAFFESGDFDLISTKDRDRIMKEIKYQHGGMVKASDIKKIGKASGADLMLSGEVIMEEKRLKGQTLKEFSLTIRIVDIESGEEIARALYETTKYSKRKGFGW